MNYSIIDRAILSFGAFVAIFPYLLVIPLAALLGANSEGLHCFSGGREITTVFGESYMKCNELPEWIFVGWAGIWVASVVIIWPIHSHYRRKCN